MMGSSNNAVSACVPCGVSSFRTWGNDVGPSPGVQPPRRPPHQRITMFAWERRTPAMRSICYEFTIS
jgi:hypothetical protein